MKNNMDFKSLNEIELKNIIENIHEKHTVELKEASNLPKSFWETYSSFCNTNGGIIILGVKEGKNGDKNTIVGVGNKEKILNDLWNQLSNIQKISFRNIENYDVNTYTIENKEIIVVYVKEVIESMKPVYISEKLENTWVRTGDGDRRATREELASFMRNASPNQDGLPAENFNEDDLDFDSVMQYKERVNRRYPKQEYLKMSNMEFLLSIGACYRDRNTRDIKIKKGTVLFFGKSNSIKEIFPQFHLDYFNYRGNNSRWSDRVSDDEPSDYEINIYNFFNIVYDKIKILLNEDFSLDEKQIRLPVSNFDETIRECLVNCLAHADYVKGYPSIRVEVYDGWFKFLNPGKMLITKEQFAIGGDSRPRNEVIMKLFRLLGVSERQGFGGNLIYKTASKNKFRMPEIITDLEHTDLKVWNIDLVDSYPELTEDEKNILRYIVKGKTARSKSEISKELEITEYAVRKAIQVLEDKKLVKKIGNGPSTKYDVYTQSTEFYTQMQIIMEMLKNCIN